MEFLMNDQVIRGESFERESTFHQEGSMHGDRNHFDANMVGVEVEAEVDDVHRMQQAEILVKEIHQVDSNVDGQADNKRVDEVERYEEEDMLSFLPVPFDQLLRLDNSEMVLSNGIILKVFLLKWFLTAII
nr:hypothetical protein Iba_chr02cCG10100 [Ipomoea batatas]